MSILEIKNIHKVYGKDSHEVHALNDVSFNVDKGVYINGLTRKLKGKVTIPAKVKIGDNCQLAPNVAIYTAGHPVHPDTRNTLYEYGIEVVIGDNVWIGGNTVICPGVHVGNNVVIGAGSVVTKDIPAYTLAVGNPCRPLRKITEADKLKNHPEWF